jgi:UDP-hydrolysing UDP-N-acetyl-D-glucosamine 2-epimerase
MRRIAVISTSRADYGHLYWPLKEIEAHPELSLELIVIGAHLSPTFGRTVELIRSDGFEISALVDCLDAEDSDVGMARTIASATAKLSEVLADLRPDMLLLIADRYEMLAPASVALALRIPIAHIEGGDISEGAVDDAVRNALTKMSHLHFTPTEDARRRVLAMGEEAWRVTYSGAPSLDHLLRSTLPGRAQLEQTLGQPLSDQVCVVAYHPVTLQDDTTSEMNAVFAALSSWQGQIVFCFPNADVGSSKLVERTTLFCRQHKQAKLYVNLDHLSYWALLGEATLMLGNSSSGIMETASLGLPTVDIGARQHGRTRARNIIHAEPDAVGIVRAMTSAVSAEFLSSISGLQNPYGDGRASKRIVKVLADAPERQILLRKKALPLAPQRDTFVQDGE